MQQGKEKSLEAKSRPQVHLFNTLNSLSKLQVPCVLSYGLVPTADVDVDPLDDDDDVMSGPG